MRASLAQPPDGSCFLIGDNAEGLLRVAWWPPAARTLRWAAVGLFTLWLCLWAVGAVAAAGAWLGPLLGQNKGLGPAQRFANVFLAGWLVLWTFAGLGAMFFLYQLVRRPRPESVIFGADELIYDPGTDYLRTNFWQAQHVRSEAFSFSFRGSKIRTITRDCFKSLRLENAGGRQRLTMDVGADRIEIGGDLREPERKWLERLLREWAGV